MRPPTVDTNPPDRDERFFELLRKLRKSTYRDGEEFEAAYEEAHSHAIHHNFDIQQPLVSAVRLLREEKWGEAISALEPLLGISDSCAHVNDLLGRAYFRRGEIDRAIECHQKAIENPGYDSRGYAWNNLGLAYRDKGDYDRAIECYLKAIDSPEYDSPGDAWHNLGLTYSDKGENDRAIECYQKALDSLEYDPPGDTWNNLGVAYESQGEYTRAIECYKKALESPDYATPGLALRNLGHVYAVIEDIPAASEAYQKSIEAYEAKGEDSLAEFVRFKVKQLEKNTSEITKDERELIESKPETIDVDSPEGFIHEALTREEARDCYERRLLQELNPYLRTGPTAQQTNGEEIANEAVSPTIDELLVLRDWSSTTPMLPPDQRHAEVRGGGYALRWRGAMVVIDPGHTFLQNFFEAGLNPLEIRAILVTHNHGDHNQDLKPLDDLLYEFCKRSPCNSKKHGAGLELVAQQVGGVAAGKGYALLWDVDSSRRLILKGENRLVRDELGELLNRVDNPTAEQLRKLLEAEAGGGYRSELTLDCDRFDQGMDCCIEVKTPAPLPIKTHYFRAYHSADVPNAVGVRLDCETDGDPFVIGFTADTEYRKELADTRALAGSRVLIAHMSQPDIAEFTDRKRRKKGHLGLWGTVDLIKIIKPELVILGEFWPGFADFRIPLTQIVQREVKSAKLQCSVLPGSRSLRVRLPSLEIQCTHCGGLSPAKEVRIAAPQVPYGRLGYLCGRCVV
jgi:tetratricopeptide (TPR) repeat protein